MKQNLGLTIRKAEVEDFSAVYQLNREFAKLYKAEDKFTLTEEQLVKDRDLFECRVALVNDVIVGFSSFFVAYYTWVGKAIYLDDLFVTKACRGQGIGDALLDDVITIAKASDCKRVVWQVSAWNKQAQKFYLEKGAVLDKKEINCIYKID